MPDQTTDRLDCLLRVAQVVNSTLDLEEVLRHVLGQARGILGAESGSIMMVQPDGRTLRVLAAEGPRAQTVHGRSQEMSQGVAGWVAVHRSPVLIHGAVKDARFHAICSRRDVRDALCAPLTEGEQLLGVISLNNRTDGTAFSEADLGLLTAISNQAALAIRNAQSYEEMERQRRTVERLLLELTRAQEAERGRISLLLHDGPAQTLFAALRNLELAKVLGRDAPPAVGEALGELEQNLRHAISETRATMLDLRPLALDDIGFYSALRQYVEQFERRSGARAQVILQGSERPLPSLVASALYRIAQEALTNVWKHGQATRVQVLVEVGERQCSLEIRDNGRGFDPTQAGQFNGHIGLKSLEDRAQLLGGQLWVESVPGQGTVVRVSAPLTREGEQIKEPRTPQRGRKRSPMGERELLCEV